jgi:hypothetical protein
MAIRSDRASENNPHSDSSGIDPLSALDPSLQQCSGKIHGPTGPTGTALESNTSQSVERTGQQVFELCAFWEIPYVVGLIVGVVGIFSLVAKTRDNLRVRIITLSFGGVYGVGVAVAVSCACMVGWRHPDSSFSPAGIGSMVLAYFFVILVVLYSDWNLGATAQNLAGVPRDFTWLYWAYFVFQEAASLVSLIVLKFLFYSMLVYRGNEGYLLSLYLKP